ncbi:unnamed protein product [Microthlaspi erraticum]|uniref:RING-type E3 ubiquitin transferase n=1 Tax=Microthlaspi erraticum TaxID=1685480 RepID=A0A6D2IJ72_9BRAS|nr:unnamed protein product [Microthlaspi erraticum]
MSIPPRVAAAIPGSSSVRRSPKRQRLVESDDSSDSSSSDEEQVGIVRVFGVPRTVGFATEASSSSDEEEEEVGIAQAVVVPRTAAIATEASSSSDEEEEDLLILEVGGVPRSATNSTPEASSSSSSSSPQSVKLKSSDVLDCPTCCEPLKKPIYQCSNGHVACSQCVTKVKNRCPFCRSHIGDIRCLVMEKIIEATIVPCKNAVYGCKETTTYGNQLSRHEELCGYIPCSCPLPGCDYTGSYTDLKSHGLSSHSWDKDNHTQFALDEPFMFTLNLGKGKVTVLREKNDGDLIVVRGFKKTHGLFVTVSCISPMTPGMRTYSCSLARLDAFTSLRLGLMVKKIQRVDEGEEEPKDGFLFIPSYMSDGNYYQKLQICIGREYKYVHI